MTANTPHLVEIQNQPEFSVIRFLGFVDAASVERAKPVIDATLAKNCANLIIDLEKVDFLDSHGVGLFVSLLRKAHSRGGRLIFSAATAQPSSVLNMVGFNGPLIAFCENLEQARALLLNKK